MFDPLFGYQTKENLSEKDEEEKEEVHEEEVHEDSSNSTSESCREEVGRLSDYEYDEDYVCAFLQEPPHKVSALEEEESPSTPQ